MVYESHRLTEETLLFQIQDNMERIADGRTTRLKALASYQKEYERTKLIMEKQPLRREKKLRFIEALAWAIAQMDEEALRNEYREQQNSSHRGPAGYA